MPPQACSRTRADMAFQIRNSIAGLKTRENALHQLKLKLDKREAELSRRETRLEIRMTQLEVLSSRLSGLGERLRKWEARLRKAQVKLGESDPAHGLKELSWKMLGLRREDLATFQIENVNPLDIVLRGLKSIYYNFAKELHPDHGGNKKKFQDLQNAWERIKNVLWKAKTHDAGTPEG